MYKRIVADSCRGWSSQRIKRLNLKFGVNTQFHSIGKYKHSYQSTRNNNTKDFSIYQGHSFIHSFHWHVQNATIPCHSQKLLPFFFVIYPFPFILFYQLFFHPPSFYLTIYFLIYLSALFFPNLYIILFWEIYFFPFSVHAQTNIIYLTLLSLF
jgi:hypothetical protein